MCRELIAGFVFPRYDWSAWKDSFGLQMALINSNCQLSPLLIRHCAPRTQPPSKILFRHQISSHKLKSTALRVAISFHFFFIGEREVLGLYDSAWRLRWRGMQEDAEKMTRRWHQLDQKQNHNTSQVAGSAQIDLDNLFRTATGPLLNIRRLNLNEYFAYRGQLMR